MYKKLSIFLLILLLVGCSKKQEIAETVIETNNNSIIAINYPITHIKKLDKLIYNHIDKTYTNFKNKYDNNSENISELNIDYSYNVIDDYISIYLKTFISTNTKSQTINEIYSIVYDKKKNKILKIEDFFSKEELDQIIPKIKQDLILKYKNEILIDLIETNINKNLANYQNFLLTTEGITIYFNPYILSSNNYNIMSIDIPVEISHTKEKKSSLIIPDVIEYDSTKPVIALTFDDGPSRYTKKIVELLKKYNAVGTFFVIGNKIDIYQDTIKLMYKNGNEIGNHSYSHKWLTRLEKNEFEKQINDTQESIKNITGSYPKLLRPTYGSINKWLRANSKLDIVMWDVDTNDWRLKSYKTIANKALPKIKDGDIILMHDVYEKTYKALEVMLPKLKESGFEFVTVSELKELKKNKN